MVLPASATQFDEASKGALWLQLRVPLAYALGATLSAQRNFIVELELEVLDVLRSDDLCRAEHELATRADLVFAEASGLERLAFLAGDLALRNRPALRNR